MQSDADSELANKQTPDMHTDAELIFSGMSDSVKSFREQLGSYVYEPGSSSHSQMRGITTSENGDKYLGEWNFHTNQKDGKGIKLFISDGTIYEGSWLEDKPNGKGRIINDDGTWYQGEWLNGVANGKGKWQSKDGSKYEGDWLNDNKHGFIKFVNPWCLCLIIKVTINFEF